MKLEISKKYLMFLRRQNIRDRQPLYREHEKRREHGKKVILQFTRKIYQIP
jgi:hypothetical protein